ncbi:TonB-dependent receptor plug [Cellulophaga geojensis KL-A]|uniref:TonB-dependent receptor plug n=2 Tax=Cellulophaga TaxID=104264 RepID=A0ABN0RMY0_9FLAO|nr:TonB-dependent receptor plug [Cellulophaga geojensis KL-A]
MKKNNERALKIWVFMKLDLKMKLSFLLFITVMFQMLASEGYSQKTKVTLELYNVNLFEVLQDIESKTDLSFFFKNTDVNLNSKVSINVKDKRIESTLEDLFKGTGTTFKIKKNQIILKHNSRKSNLEKEKLEIVSQQFEVKGKIVDENGIPLLGATVVVKGTGRGVSANKDGKYTIVANNGNDVLVFSYIGFQNSEILINNKSIINVTLKESIEKMEEVVLVGYGKVKKENLTGSVSTIDVKDIANQAPTVNIDNALQGQVAGVYVSSSTGQPGAAARIRIRGTTSLLGSNQPLFVIDGIPVVPNSNIPIGGTEGGNLGNELAQEGLSTPIGNINTSDIESISILKDASAAAIYGSRAANGVIIINTKQGVYSGKTKFDASVSFSSQNAQTLDVLNAAQFKDVWTQAVTNGSRNDAFARSVLDGSYFGDADTDWEKEVGPGIPLATAYNLNVYGGSKTTRYSASLGVNTQEGVYDNTGFDKYTFNTNLDTKINDRWSFGTKLNVSSTDQESVDGGLTQLIYNFRPDLTVFDEGGNYSFSSQFNSENPVARSNGTNSNVTLLVLGSIYTQIKLAKGLKLKSLFSLNYNNGNQKSFYPAYTFTGGWGRLTGDGDGYAQESRSRFTNTLWQNTLTYEGFFGKHNINSVVGVSFEKNKSSNTKGWGEGFFNDVLTNINSATVFTDASSFESGSGLESYFGRVNYDYDNKYLLTLSARVDGSSKFAKDNQYAFFPAAALAWRISGEPFLRNNKFIDELKIRASLGKTGQQDFGDYAWRTLYETEDYGPDPSIILTQLGNDKLKWETTDQFDLGLDFSLFNSRLSGTLGYYTKETKDALFTAITPGNTGVNRVIANIGNTKNEGYELELKASIIRKKDFAWNVSFNISKNDNTLTKISDDFKDDDGFLTGFPGGGRLREGSPIGLIYGYVADGLFQEQSEIDNLNEGSETGVYQNSLTAPGDIKFLDINGPDGVPDGRITNLDQRVIGDTQPDFFGGINNTFTYKGFSLSTFFTYSIGNDLDAFGLARGTNFASTFIGENKINTVLNAWSPENTDTDIPRAVYFDPNNNDRVSTHYVYDASYLRLKTVNLSYNFSKQLINQLKGIDRVSVYVTGQNLFTVTDYPGADPEASNLYNNDISAGRDNNRFPISKVFTTGIKIGF